MRHTIALLSILGTASAAWAVPLLTVPDTSNDRIMLFNGYDGSLVNANFLDLSSQPEGGTPMAAVMVGSELWISDQSADGVFRYTLDGSTFIGMLAAPSGGYSSPAGIEVAGPYAYVADRGNDRIVLVDAFTALPIGTFPVGFDGTGTPYDVLAVDQLGFGPELLIGDASGTGDADNIDVFSMTGTFQRTFHNSDGSSGIDSPQQLGMTATGTILAAGNVAPYGIFEYSTTGQQINYWSRTGGVRGVHVLGDANILFTDSSGVHKLNPTTGEVTDILTGISARHIEAYVPEPASVGFLLLGAVAVLARRR